MQKIVYPKVSFIIPTLNASRFLTKCLSAIRAQDYPQQNIEIIIADGGSTDNTLEIATKYKSIIIENPDILHEHGKSRASMKAKGEILFYTDSDNILTKTSWLNEMVRPYIYEKNVIGFLPQTIPAPDSNAIDRYLGYLFTDPFTWFVYGLSANPQTYKKKYTPLKKNKYYELYKFGFLDYPLFGLSQGVGTTKKFKRTNIAFADDLLAGIKLMKEGGIIAYIPGAEIYHYHVSGLNNFINKYRWRIRNNITKKVRGMGFTNRTQYFNIYQKIRMILFIPYAYTIILPTVDSIRLMIRYRNPIMLYHLPITVILATLIMVEYINSLINKNIKLGSYE